MQPLNHQQRTVSRWNTIWKTTNHDHFPPQAQSHFWCVMDCPMLHKVKPGEREWPWV